MSETLSEQLWYACFNVETENTEEYEILAISYGLAERRDYLQKLDKYLRTHLSVMGTENHPQSLSFLEIEKGERILLHATYQTIDENEQHTDVLLVHVLTNLPENFTTAAALALYHAPEWQKTIPGDTFPEGLPALDLETWPQTAPAISKNDAKYIEEYLPQVIMAFFSLTEDKQLYLVTETQEDAILLLHGLVSSLPHTLEQELHLTFSGNEADISRSNARIVITCIPPSRSEDKPGPEAAEDQGILLDCSRTENSSLPYTVLKPTLQAYARFVTDCLVQQGKHYAYLQMIRQKAEASHIKDISSLLEFSSYFVLVHQKNISLTMIDKILHSPTRELTLLCLENQNFQENIVAYATDDPNWKLDVLLRRLAQLSVYSPLRIQARKQELAEKVVAHIHESLGDSDAFRLNALARLLLNLVAMTETPDPFQQLLDYQEKFAQKEQKYPQEVYEWRVYKQFLAQWVNTRQSPENPKIRVWLQLIGHGKIAWNKLIDLHDSRLLPEPFFKAVITNILNARPRDTTTLRKLLSIRQVHPFPIQWLTGYMLDFFTMQKMSVHDIHDFLDLHIHTEWIEMAIDNLLASTPRDWNLLIDLLTITDRIDGHYTPYRWLEEYAFDLFHNDPPLAWEKLKPFCIPDLPEKWIMALFPPYLTNRKGSYWKTICSLLDKQIPTQLLLTFIRTPLVEDEPSWEQIIALLSAGISAEDQKETILHSLTNHPPNWNILIILLEKKVPFSWLETFLLGSLNGDRAYWEHILDLLDRGITPEQIKRTVSSSITERPPDWKTVITLIRKRVPIEWFEVLSPTSIRKWEDIVSLLELKASTTWLERAIKHVQATNWDIFEQLEANNAPLPWQRLALEQLITHQHRIPAYGSQEQITIIKILVGYEAQLNEILPAIFLDTRTRGRTLVFISDLALGGYRPICSLMHAILEHCQDLPGQEIDLLITASHLVLTDPSPQYTQAERITTLRRFVRENMKLLTAYSDSPKIVAILHQYISSFPKQSKLSEEDKQTLVFMSNAGPLLSETIVSSARNILAVRNIRYARQGGTREKITEKTETPRKEEVTRAQNDPARKTAAQQNEEALINSHRQAQAVPTSTSSDSSDQEPPGQPQTRYTLVIDEPIGFYSARAFEQLKKTFIFDTALALKARMEEQIEAAFFLDLYKNHDLFIAALAEIIAEKGTEKQTPSLEIQARQLQIAHIKDLYSLAKYLLFTRLKEEKGKGPIEQALQQFVRSGPEVAPHKDGVLTGKELESVNHYVQIHPTCNFREISSVYLFLQRCEALFSYYRDKHLLLPFYLLESAYGHTGIANNLRSFLPRGKKK